MVALRNVLRRVGLAVMVAAALVSLEVRALAEEPASDDALSGYYVGASFTMGFEQFRDLDELDVPSNILPGDIDEAFGADLWVGSRWGDHFAWEANFAYLEGFDANLRGRIEGFPIDIPVELRMFSLTANGRWIVRPGRIEPFLIAGVGATRIEGEFNGRSSGSTDDYYFIFVGGGGLDVWVTQRTGLRLATDYVLTAGDIASASAHADMVRFRVGLQFRF